LQFITKKLEWRPLQICTSHTLNVAIRKKSKGSFMATVQALVHSLDIAGLKLSKEESALLEVELFARICEEFKEIIKSENKDYFRLLKLDSEKEKIMIETNFIRCMINDILKTEEYTLPGIAYYTDTPEEIIFEVATGQNTSPTFSLSQKIINLHRSVRPMLYHGIVNKIKIKNENEASI
jgi:hypothetical protein